LLKNKYEKGSKFTSKYNLNILVYYESLPTIIEAIAREKKLKGITRAKKEYLINKFNPLWNDLYDKALDEE
jgi:putative endonuclease